MGLFSNDGFKIKNGVCTVKFKKTGIIDYSRADKLLNNKKVRACQNIVVEIGKLVTGIVPIALSSIEATRIEADADNLYYKSIDGNLYSKDGTALIRYASKKTEDELILPKEVITIASKAFSLSYNLKSMTIHEKVKNIGDDAFSHCHNLNIYCQAPYLPHGWSKDWNSSNCYVVWDYRKNPKP